MHELELKLNTNKNGTNAYQIIEVLKELGFDAKGIKVTHEALNDIIYPCIAHVTINSRYNHYIVIYKIDNKNKRLLIADPASSIKKISFDEFFKIWNGIVITMYPVKVIKYSNETNILSFIRKKIRKNKKAILFITIFSWICLILQVVSSLSLKVFYEMYENKINIFSEIFIAFLFVNMIKNIFNFLRNKILIFVNKQIDKEMNMEIYDKVINLPYQYFRNRTSGEIVSKILDLDKIRSFISNLIVILVNDIPLMIVSSFILYFIDNRLFMISFLMLIIYSVIYIISSKKIYIKSNNCLNERANYSSFLFESINSFETVKGLNIENKIKNKYYKNYTNYLNSLISLDTYINRQNLYKDIIENTGELLVLYIGINFVSFSNLSIGNLLAFNSVLLFFLTPIRNILDLNYNFEQAKNAYKKAFEIVIENTEKGSNIENITSIKLNNLTYYYDQKIVLKNINLKFKKGEKVIITGSSGSGKSTLLKLLMQYYDVNKETIFINGKDITNIKNIRNKVKYISQNELLFTDTILNNINLQEENIDRINEVTSICNIKDIYSSNDLGLNMMLEENGFNISGGQKQRIILARSLLKDFDVLLIDEGTNQIDVSLEREILKRLFNLYRNKIIIIISHRLENLDLFNRYVELKNGMVVKNLIRKNT